MNKTVKFILGHFEEILASIFIVITTSLVLVNVFLRYFMRTGLYWTEEVTTSCFVWCVFLGAAAGYRRGMHIGVDILVNKLPNTMRNIVRILVDLILLFTNGYLFYLSVVFVAPVLYKTDGGTWGIIRMGQLRADCRFLSDYDLFRRPYGK